MRYRDAIFDSYRSFGFSGDYVDDAAGKATIAEAYAWEMTELLPKNRQAKVLDLGCGSGYLVRWLVDLGYTDVHGVDVSAEQIAYARGLGLPVCQGDCLDYLATHGGFDAIISTDVIEHQTKEEVIDFLEAIRRALVPGGTVILRTGNMSSIYGLTIRYIDFTHETGFNEPSLRQVLLATGFRDIRITDNKAPFGWKPKRLARWVLFKLWRAVLNLAFFIEVGENRPRLLGKLLIASAKKPE